MLATEIKQHRWKREDYK